MTQNTPDYGHQEADKELQSLIKRLHNSYKLASTELQKKIDDYLAEFEKEDAKKRALYDSGELSHEEFLKWREKQIIETHQWQDMLNQLTNDLVNQDQIAASMIDDTLPEVYAINHNYGTYEAEVGSGYDTTYTLYDKFTVSKLLKEEQQLLPYPNPSVDIPKDKLWNRQHIQSAVLQGILQGESMGDIAKRMQNVAEMDERVAIRSARTAVTGAENAGRIDSYIRAENMGIKLKQMWLATLDGRTRDSHAIMDGEQQEVGKPFSNGCRYPGDPKGAPAEIYNCRCTLVAVVEGADPYNPNLRKSSYLEEQDLTYDKWKKMHELSYYSYTKEGLELYRTFIEGGSGEIHEIAGFQMGNYINGYNPQNADKKKLKELDTVFHPAEEEMSVYKGTWFDNDTKKYITGQSVNHSLSSTTLSKMVADQYSYRAYEVDGNGTAYPVIQKITIEKGVPIADARKLLGTDGMKAFEQEITIGRETVWYYGDLVKVTDEFGNVHYEQNVIVRPKNTNISVLSSGEAIAKDTANEKVCKAGKVNYLAPKWLNEMLSESEIIDKVTANDFTRGSCVSQAYTYVAEKNGINVLDYRSGQSQSIFSDTRSMREIANFSGVDSVIMESYNDFETAHELMNKIEDDKEYCLGVGRHMAIVKKEDGKYKYLDLQSENNKGWHILDDDALKNRYGCRQNHIVNGEEKWVSSYLIETESLGRNVEFQGLLGYINTNTEQ